MTTAFDRLPIDERLAWLDRVASPNWSVMDYGVTPPALVASCNRTSLAECVRFIRQQNALNPRDDSRYRLKRWK